MNINKKMFIKRSLIFIGMIIFILLVIGLLSNKLAFFDSLIYNFIIKYRSPFLTTFFKIITFFASVEWFVVLIILILVFNKERKLNVVMILYLIAIVIITLIMKNVFIRERPYELMIIEETGYSFPSGHSSVSLAFYGFVAYLVYLSKYSKKKKIIISSLLLLLSFLIGISRIYLGVHYPTDVLAGFMVGLIYLIIFILIYDVRKRRFG